MKQKNSIEWLLLSVHSWKIVHSFSVARSATTTAKYHQGIVNRETPQRACAHSFNNIVREKMEEKTESSGRIIFSIKIPLSKYLPDNLIRSMKEDVKKNTKREKKHEALY